MKILITMAFALVLVIAFSGCTLPEIPGQAVCGNEVVETGEECDGEGCSTMQVCENCKCVALTPPAMPE